MSVANYLNRILDKYAVNQTAAEAAAQSLYSVIERWSNGNLLRADFSGSLAKGTAVSIGTDADVFVSLSSTTPGTLENMYNTLYDAFSIAGYASRKQNVSIGVDVNGYKVDIVPGRRQSQYGNDHSLYKKKDQSWTKTNISTHINTVQQSDRTDEIKLAKIWRELHGLDFPSFYLELAIIDALKFSKKGDVVNNFLKVLNFFASSISNAVFVDPANSNNVISNDLTGVEKLRISRAAANSLNQGNWSRVVW